MVMMPLNVGGHWWIKRGPSAYHEPDVLFHYNEPTGMTSGPMLVLWRWTTVSLHQYHQRNPGAPSGASCPQLCICAEDRWTVRRRWACPCAFRNFVLLFCRGPVYFLQIPYMYWKVCSPCWIAEKEGCCFLEATVCGIMLSQLCWETFLKLQRAHICCRCSLAHENIPSTVAPPLYSVRPAVPDVRSSSHQYWRYSPNYTWDDKSILWCVI